MIDTATLKNSILDLAFQGKLTSQDSADGSAEDLYNEICDEKNELIKLGKIRKNKIIPIKGEEEGYQLILIYNKDKYLSTAARAFVDFIKEWYGDREGEHND